MGALYLSGILPSSSEKKNQGETIPDRLYTVVPGDLPIGITLTGNVNAKQKHKMALEAAFNTKLLWIIDENAKVKEGDVLAKFETEDLEDKIEDLKVNLEDVNKEIEIAKESRRVQESSNLAEVRAAKDSVTDAEQALIKYHKFEKNKEKDAKNLAVDQAEKEMDQAKSEYEDLVNETQMKSFHNRQEREKTEQEITTLKRKFNQAKVNLKSAVLDKKLFKRYNNPNKITDLNNKLAQAKLNLNKTKIKTASSLVQQDKNIKNLETKKRKIEKNLKDHESYLPMMRLISPAEGVVIYGDPDRRWNRTNIKVGMDIRRKQTLLTIPDMSELVVDFDLPEQYRSKIKIGDKAIITPDSIKTLSVPGKVSEISSLPVHRIRWDHSSPKIYNSKIELERQNAQLVSGMTVQVEIITLKLENVLFVPIEAVFEKEGKFYVYVQSLLNKPKRVDVDVGLSNENFVHIKNGLREGDVVYLYRPFPKNSRN